MVMNYSLKSISFIICCFVSIIISAQEVVSAGGMDFVEMSQSKVQNLLEGNYYVYRPSSDMFYDVDDGTLGITASFKGITLSHGFAQTCYPAKGSGNITGAVTETVEYYNGKWYEHVSKDGSLIYYAYLNFEIDINVMNFRNTVWTGNSTIHEPKIGRTKGVFFQQHKDGTWLYISNNGKFTFKHYTDAELKEAKARKEAAIRKQERQKKEKERLEAQRIERERRAKEERIRQEEEARIQKEARRKKESDERAAYAKWEKAYQDSIHSGSFRGQECVDLGLSVVWATCNLGAKSPQKGGKGYSGGQVSQVMKNKNGWRLPTSAECWELINNCTIEPVGGFLHTKYLKLTSKKNGNSIIIPNSAGVVSSGICVRLWTSSIDGGYGLHMVWKQTEISSSRVGSDNYKHELTMDGYYCNQNEERYAEVRCVIEKSPVKK